MPEQDASDECVSHNLRAIILKSAEAGKHAINKRADDAETITSGSGATLDITGESKEAMILNWSQEIRRKSEAKEGADIIGFSNNVGSPTVES